jgi:CBS domain-containing protein
VERLSVIDLKVSKIMTKNLVTIPLGSMVEEAVKKMVDFDVECLPRR